MIARAKTLNGKIVEGYYIENSIGVGFIQVVGKFIPNEIDSKTLEYKIGDEWYSMEELTNIVLNGS